MASPQLVTALSNLAVYLSSPLLDIYPDKVLDIFIEALVNGLLKAVVPSTGPSSEAVYILTSEKFPPLPFLRACFAARVSWSTWICSLGGHAAISIQPTFIFVRLGDMDSQIFRITNKSPVLSYKDEGVHEEIMPVDESDEEIFTLINEATVWDMPHSDDSESLSAFSDCDEDLDILGERRASSPPMTARPIAPAPAETKKAEEPLLTAPELVSSASSSHSRSSSRSSIFTSISFSEESASSSVVTSPSDSPVDACVADLPLPEDPDTPKPENLKKKDGNRRRRRDRIHVEPARMVLTPYDGGKTTVLTGGVMLGPGPKAPKVRAVKSDPARA